MRSPKPTIPSRAERGIPHPLVSSKVGPSRRRFEQAFNRSGFSRLLNSPAGRIFRLAAGAGFLVVGFLYRGHTLGVLSMVWGILPLSAGALDICYISALLGGPLAGAKIRSKSKAG